MSHGSNTHNNNNESKSMGEVISIIRRTGVGGSPGNKPERAMQMMTRPLAKMNPKAVANVAGIDIWYENR